METRRTSPQRRRRPSSGGAAGVPGVPGFLLLFMGSLLAVLLLLLGVATTGAGAAVAQNNLHSLKGPFTLPFWSITENFVRLAEDRQNRRGSVWNVVPNMHANWEALVTFRIHGVSGHGADGLAFWYTDRINKMGSLFGNDEAFRGVGVIVDTYDNDGAGVHPYVMLVQNDGTKKFNPEHEHGVHKERETDLELGGCTFNIRNLEKPSHLRITYYNRRLTVETALEDAGFTLCIDLNNLDLPTGHYFGFTAATGQLADNHDIHRFVVRGLDEQGKPQDLPACDEGSDVGRALSQVQHELADSKKQLESLVSKLPSAGAPREASGDSKLQREVDELRQSVERNHRALETKIEQLDRSIASLSLGARETGDGGGATLITWITCVAIIVSCGATLFFQYQAYLRRKQKFF